MVFVRERIIGGSNEAASIKSRSNHWYNSGSHLASFAYGNMELKWKIASQRWVIYIITLTDENLAMLTHGTCPNQNLSLKMRGINFFKCLKYKVTTKFQPEN